MSGILHTKNTIAQDWHTEDIKAEIRKKGWNLSKLALHHGYPNSSTLRQAFYKPFPRAEKIIADAIGVSPEVIWPTRFQARNLKKQIGITA